MGTQTKRIQYRYDSRGNRSALIDHDGGRFTYSYDSVNRITQVLNPQGDRTTYSYDEAGRRTLKKMSNGTRASFTYDAAGNLTELYNLKSTGAVISSFDYVYDKVGNRTAVAETGGGRVTWSYDNAYQLTGEHRTGANAYRDTYTYDPAGNRLLKNHDGARTTYAYDAANQLTYSQDASGRSTFTFDADGNQHVVREPSGNRTTYVWDYENRMTSARLASGVRNTMAYDADGLRVKLEESTGTKKFVWDDRNYLGETDAANDTQVIYTNEPLQYGNLISQRRGGTSHWYHFDALGSTRELTNSSVVVTDTRLYDAWGNAVATTGSTVSPLRWVGDVGYYFDSQVGLYYVRARSYSLSLARWASLDPIRFIWVTPYGYALNCPLLLIDSRGTFATRTDPFTYIDHWEPEPIGRHRRSRRVWADCELRTRYPTQGDPCSSPVDFEVYCIGRQGLNIIEVGLGAIFPLDTAANCSSGWRYLSTGVLPTVTPSPTRNSDESFSWKSAGRTRCAPPDCPIMPLNCKCNVELYIYPPARQSQLDPRFPSGLDVSLRLRITIEYTADDRIILDSAASNFEKRQSHNMQRRFGGTISHPKRQNPIAAAGSESPPLCI